MPKRCLRAALIYFFSLPCRYFDPQPSSNGSLSLSPLGIPRPYFTIRMASSLPYGIAAVIYEYVWNVEDTSKQTSTYTTTYSTRPGTHTAYALVVNTAMSSPSQIETVGIPFTIVSGETSTQRVLATVATHSPTAPVLRTNHALATPTTESSVRTTTRPKDVDHEVLAGGTLSPHRSYFTYLQVVLVCLFCGGYLWSRCRKHLRSGNGRFKGRRSIVSTSEKRTIKGGV